MEQKKRIFLPILLASLILSFTGGCGRQLVYKRPANSFIPITTDDTHTSAKTEHSTATSISTATATETATQTDSSIACSPFRLDQLQADQTHGSMMDVPVRDQGAYGICYGEVASQLNDAYRFGVLKDPAIGRNTAVLSATLGQTKTDSDSTYDGGTVCEAVESIRKNGYRSNFEVIDCLIHQQTKDNVLGLYHFHKDYHDAIEAEEKRLTEIGKSDQLLKFIEARSDQQRQEILSWIAKQGNERAIQPTKADIRSLLELRALRFIWGVEAFQCFQSGPKYEAKLPACIHENLAITPVEKRIKKIDETLSTLAGQPLGIGYCGTVLKNGNGYPGYTLTSTNKAACFPASDSNGNLIRGDEHHASLIIGRRKDPTTQRCQYLVRNSWNNVCETQLYPDTLPPELRNDPDLPTSLQSPALPPVPIYAKEWTCEKGNVWVDQDVLVKSIYGLNYLGK